jgi:mannonate dehydratase
VGGKCRDAVPVYRHADGADLARWMRKSRLSWEGYQYIRCQFGDMAAKRAIRRRPNRAVGTYFDALTIARRAPRPSSMCGSIRDEVELLHDVHDRLTPWIHPLGQDLDPYRLFSETRCRRSRDMV